MRSRRKFQVQDRFSSLFRASQAPLAGDEGAFARVHDSALRLTFYLCAARARRCRAREASFL